MNFGLRSGWVDLGGMVELRTYPVHLVGLHVDDGEDMGFVGHGGRILECLSFGECGMAVLWNS